MSRRLFRSGEAAQDLFDIWNHIAEDSVVAADRVLGRIVEAEHRLLAFPEMGRRRPDVSADLRHWPVGAYLIFYRVTPDHLEVVRVVHGARDLGGLFDDASD